MYEYVAEQ
jgi:protein phosphatase 1 regulatory subunit 42